MLGELRKKYIELELSEDAFVKDLSLIHRWCVIQNIDEAMSIRAGEIRATINRKNISLIDCVQLALAERLNYQVISTDRHFNDDVRAVYLVPGDN